MKVWMVSLLILPLIASSTVYARPSQEVFTTYYSDENRTSVVGRSWLFCFGGYRQTGKKTKWKTTTRTSCDDSRFREERKSHNISRKIFLLKYT